jgi:hypothetical protein
MPRLTPISQPRFERSGLQPRCCHATIARFGGSSCMTVSLAAPADDRKPENYITRDKCDYRA